MQFLLFTIVSCESGKIRDHKVSDYLSSKIIKITKNNNYVILDVEFSNLSSSNIVIHSHGRITKSISGYSLSYLGHRFLYPKDFVDLRFTPKEKKVIRYKFVLDDKFIIAQGLPVEITFDSLFSRLSVESEEIEFRSESNAMLTAK